MQKFCSPIFPSLQDFVVSPTSHCNHYFFSDILLCIFGAEILRIATRTTFRTSSKVLLNGAYNQCGKTVFLERTLSIFFLSSF